jgi:regulatory protein YycH of two-component signal transduction system YycFG
MEMKKLLMIAFGVAMFTNTAQAKEPVCSESEVKVTNEEKLEIKTDVPKHLAGAIICVKQTDGKESCVPAEKFKVVPRKQQFITTKVETEKLKQCVTNDPAKNRVSVLGGYGAKNGLKTSQSGNTVTVESKSGANAGAQYQRMVTDRISVGVQGQTNKTGSLMIGLDF